MLPYQTALLVLASLLSLSAAAPALVISHHNNTSGETLIHKMDTERIPQLASILGSNNVNINVVTDRAKRDLHFSRPALINRKRAGLNDTTLNLTIISKRSNTTTISNSTSFVPTVPHPSEPEADSDVSDVATHTVNIDASSQGSSGGGGISNSTINVNFNSRRSTSVGEHSVLLDLSTSDSSSPSEGSGIEASTVHVNILPARADRTIGDHSILIASSSSDKEPKTTAGDHSAVVDTSSTSSNPSKGVTGSTINVTVVKPKIGRALRPRSRKAVQAAEREERLRLKRGVVATFADRAGQKKTFVLLRKPARPMVVV